ncbi:ankyrin repeat-containing domain protein [Rhexocercosporidium sp. MPI-PUGE-AT-0058]|nr:ankyrin repeat-containing domain protein [Rhexocercosporidium sp. MPI-PUGE-AT-0058]
MFKRAFPLIGDYHADPLARRLGICLRCAAECGHTMLALHLLQIGALSSGHQAESFEDYNPLWSACRHGDETLVRLLLRKGANPNIAPNMPQSTPLQIAARRGHLGIARALLDYGADMYKSSKDGPPPIVSALELEHLAIIRLLRQRGPTWNPRISRISFDRAAARGLESAIRLLIQEGVEPTGRHVAVAVEHRQHHVAEILRNHLAPDLVELGEFWESLDTK